MLLPNLEMQKRAKRDGRRHALLVNGLPKGIAFCPAARSADLL
jgi:hypothetical protein